MAVSTSQTPFLTVTKSFTYRGLRELWSNVYHLDSLPGSSTEWQELLNAAWLLETVFMPADVQVETGTGHAAGTPPELVWETDVPPLGGGGTTGTWVPAAQQSPAPGDAAAWVRWGTDLKNKRGKPIYLRNYYHGMYITTSGDTIAPGQVTGLQALGAAWQAGLTISGRTFRRAGPNHGSPQNHAVSPYITTRTLKRRGKKKKAAALSLELAGGPGIDAQAFWSNALKLFVR